MVSMVSKHGAFVSTYFLLRRLWCELGSFYSSDLHVGSWMSPMIENRFGMYSRLKFCRSRKARITVMSFEGAMSSNLMTS